MNSNKKNKKNRELAVILLSGGMDSCVITAIAAEKYDLACLHLNYGQRTEDKELQSFQKICDHYNVKHRLIVDVNYLKQIGGSSLTDHSIEVPEAALHSKEIPNTYVPFRNANILSIAVSWAEVINAAKIFVGAVAEDSSGYPDTRREFYDAFEKTIETGTKLGDKLKIETPIINLKKSEIVKLGMRLKAPFELSWSCYKSSEAACGECDSCALRLRGFSQAGYKDPIPYSSDIFSSETFV